MNNGGTYNRNFVWLVRSYTLDTSSGSQIPSWNGTDTLWGSLEEATGSYSDTWGATRNRTEATITLRQFPSVSSQDRLVDALFNHTYSIDSIAIDWEGNQTICTGYRIEKDNV